jgi:glucose-1-phosphate thymidylyltransferase
MKIACLEGIAFRKGWISPQRLEQVAQHMIKNQYGQYLMHLVEESRKGNLQEIE